MRVVKNTFDQEREASKRDDENEQGTAGEGQDDDAGKSALHPDDCKLHCDGDYDDHHTTLSHRGTAHRENMNVMRRGEDTQFKCCKLSASAATIIDTTTKRIHNYENLYFHNSLDLRKCNLEKIGTDDNANGTREGDLLEEDTLGNDTTIGTKGGGDGDNDSAQYSHTDALRTIECDALGHANCRGWSSHCQINAMSNNITHLHIVKLCYQTL